MALNAEVTFEVQIKSLEGLPPRSFIRSTGKRRWYATLSVGVVSNRTTSTSRTPDGLVAWGEKFTITIPTKDRPPARLALYRARGGSNDERVAEADDLDLIKISQVKELRVDVHDVHSRDKSHGRLSIEARVQLPTVELVCPKPLAGQLSNLPPVPQPWQRFLSAFQQTVELARRISELDPAAKTAVGVIAFALTAVIKQVERDQGVSDLREMMTSLLLFFHDVESVQKNPFLRKVLSTTLRQVSECTYFILQYQEIESFVQRTAVHLTSDTDEILAGFFATFSNLKAELALGTSLQTVINTEFILNKVNDIDTFLHINRLKHLEDSGWRADKQCLPLVRDFTMNRIHRWISGFEQALFVLAGPPGSGKSAILHTIAGSLDEQKRLGTGLFISEHTEGKKTADLVMRTLVYYLAMAQPRVGQRIASEMAQYPSLDSADAIRYGDLLERISRDLVLYGPLVIIVDGLHELATPRDQEIVEAILMKIATTSHNKLRFIVSSRDVDIARRRTAIYWEIGMPSALCLSNVDASSAQPTETSGTIPITSPNTEFAELSSPISLAGYDLHDLAPLLRKHSLGSLEWVSLVQEFLLTVPPLAKSFLDELFFGPLPQTEDEAIQRLSDTRSKILPVINVLDYDFLYAPSGSRLFISQHPLNTELDALGVFRATVDLQVQGLQGYEINIPPSLPKFFASSHGSPLLPMSDSPLNIYQICLRDASRDGQGPVYARIALPNSEPLIDSQDIENEFWRYGVRDYNLNRMSASSPKEGCEWIVFHHKLFELETKDGYTSFMAATPVMTHAILERLTCIWVWWTNQAEEGTCMRLRGGEEQTGFLEEDSFTNAVYNGTHSELSSRGKDRGELRPGDQLKVKTKYKDNRLQKFAVIAMALKY